jgi:signal transduction histidine kinase
MTDTVPYTFAESSSSTPYEDDTWKLFIVDDDKDIHEITKLALKDLKFKDKSISFVSAYSAAEAITYLQHNPQFAIVLLDIGMETNDAGLDVATFIREQLKDNLTRIIIRTGQPGDVPEQDIIDNYDINDYKSKTELTLEKLFISIRTAIAQYDQINELANLNKDLENRIQIAVEKQQEQQEALFLQNRAVQMGELLNMLAHQWRQPLSRITAVTTQLKLALALGEVDPGEFDKQVSGIENYTNELSDTIDEFRMVYEPSDFSHNTPVCDILEKSISIMSSLFKLKNIHTNLLCAPGSQKFCTSAELYQVVLSILKNSQEAFAENKVAEPTINISVTQETDLLKICIQDNAGGIPAALIHKIFDPYFSTKTNKNGHGLGLYMSKKIIEQHCHGQLDVSTTDTGTSFIINLPNK